MKDKIEKNKLQEYKRIFQMAKKMHMVHALKFACYQVAYWNNNFNLYSSSDKKMQTNPLNIMDAYVYDDYKELNTIFREWNTFMKQNGGCLCPIYKHLNRLQGG